MGAQRRRLIVSVATVAAALSLAACGSSDFKNNPRPAAPIELGARIGSDGVTIGPQKVGAGPATITISNQTSDPARLVLEGPSDDSSTEIVPQGTGSLQTTLKEGGYTVSDGNSGRQTKLVVGSERASSQNDLLLP
jgi:hypothetical protein